MTTQATLSNHTTTTDTVTTYVRFGGNCYPASNPVILTSTITPNNNLELCFEGHPLAPDDKLYVESTLDNVQMYIRQPSQGYALSGETEQSDPVPAPQWIPVEDGSIMADFQTPDDVDQCFTWKFTICATPPKPSIEAPTPADPIMIIKKIRRS